MANTYLNSASIDGQEAPQVRKDNRKRVPKGYDSDDKFLQEMRERYDNGVGFDEHNIIAGQDDARFAVGNQWEPTVENMRRSKNKPVLTFNRLMAFVGQLLGDRLVNETEIRVLPDKGGTKEIASIREGLIRNIFKNSMADFARDEAQKYQIISGQGAYCLSIDYSSDDVFEQEIKIKPIADPYSAIFDPMSIDPTGGDAEWGFLGDDIPLATFKERWPKAAEVDWDNAPVWNRRGYWKQQDTIRIVSYWCMVTEGTKTLAMFENGQTHDVTDLEEFEYLDGNPEIGLPPVARRPDGSPYIRDVPNRFARLYICSGSQILDGPYDYPISSIPIYRVSGWQVNDGDRVQRWGIVRFMKDPQRLYNFFRSVQAEQLVSAPRNKWLTTPEAVKGHETRWRNSPVNDDPFLYYNDDGRVPVPVPPPSVDQALLEQSITAVQDMKDISNIHEASLGAPSNEVSKVAIQQRQMVSDVGSFIYRDRLRMADERCAKNINELIPHIYDTTRTIVTVGADSKTTLQVINSGENDNITLGKYGITVTVGPATATKRQQNLEQMTAFVNANPQAAMLIMDLIAEGQDWPKSDEIARRFKAQMPPGMIPTDELTPEMIQMQQMQQQMQQQATELEAAHAQAETAKVVSDAKLNEARAILAQAQAEKALADAHARLTDVNSKVEERDTQQVMDIIDQHNNLEAEDRDFAFQSQTRNDGESK